jgi:hypothetical protein
VALWLASRAAADRIWRRMSGTRPPASVTAAARSGGTAAHTRAMCRGRRAPVSDFDVGRTAARERSCECGDAGAQNLGGFAGLEQHGSSSTVILTPLSLTPLRARLPGLFASTPG